METNNIERYEVDGNVYTKSNYRMVYTPEYHENHYKAFTTSDLAFLCRMHKVWKPKDIAAALGRTYGSCSRRLALLKKNGQYEYYRNLEID